MTLAMIALACAALAVATGRLHVLLHMLQQEHYENARLHLWVRKEADRRQLPTAVALVVAGVITEAAGLVAPGAAVLLSVVALALAAAWLRATWSRDQIKPLVLTPRAQRLFGVSWTISAVVLALAVLGAPGHPLVSGVVGAALSLAAAFVLGAANRMLEPYQRFDNARFVRSAERRLAEVSPLVVGVSGSFGKTTTKACLAAALEPYGPCYPTPASFNSKLGIVRAINEGLERDHATFIAELGAYRIGDIAELCALVKPTIGVLTSLGPAHLERFGSMDAIEQAEGELADALGPDGLFVTDAADERCRRVARDRARCSVKLISAAPHPEADLWAEAVELSSGGTSFDLHRRDGGEPVRVRMRLLGAHNIANALAAAAVAQHLGITDAQFARVIRRVAPPKHRLEPIVNGQAGVVVIDDSYNSNPVGAAGALEVLAAHEARRRILVTPGMVELGDREAEENHRLGTRAASVCDLVILSGPLAGHIEAGLLEAGFEADRIIRTPDGPSAHAAIAGLTRSGDVFLFENDLPDVYG
jgi:UDP-N-acetylmuramoyl-tripeptide--D-alanyl-D-alanine ligase